MRKFRTLALCAGAAFACLSTSTANATITFTPLSSNAVVGSLPASQPFTLPPGWSQQTLFTNQENGLYRSGGTTGVSNFDMIVQNETGPNRGRYIFTVNETNGGGLVRYDRVTDTPVQLLVGGLNGVNYRALDPVRWTPWGTIVMGEEVANGRLIEITNPLGNPGSIVAIDRPRVGRVSWEAFEWDAASGVAYYQDEENTGAIYKLVPVNSAANYNPADPNTSPLAGPAQIFALRVNGANVEQREGTAVWVALNNADGTPIAGITDPTVDARAAADQVNATNYRRPEDMSLVTRNGVQYLIVAATTPDTGTNRHHVYSIDLTSNMNAPVVRSFVDDILTINASTGSPVDALSNIFVNPDNIAIDAFGDVWIIEDNSPGNIWKATWGTTPGVAGSIARFASLSTAGAEPTGLYFDILNPNIAFVNVQHPSDGIDRMIQLAAVPEPATWLMLIGGFAMVGGAMRRRSPATVRVRYT